MKILLISRLFWPSNAIGAVRPTNMAKELSKLGNELICIVGTGVHSAIDLDKTEIIRVPSGIVGKWRNKRKLSTGINTNESGGNRKHKEKAIAVLRWNISQLLYIIDELEWFVLAVRYGLRVCKEENIGYMVTSYGPISTVWVGERLKKKHPEMKWVLDLRDPLNTSSQAWWRTFFGEKIQRKVIKKADCVTTVSYSLQEYFSSIRTQAGILDNRVYTVENGYESFSPKLMPLEDGILRIGYTGQLYSGLSDMSGLFKALDVLEKKNGKLNVELHYAGKDYSELEEQASGYSSSKYLINHGSVSRDASYSIQEKCDVLCVLSWNTNLERGVLTGKFPEYLRLKRTILALISGDTPHAELTKRIEDLKIGFSYEYVNPELFQDFVNWLDRLLQQKKDGQITVQANISKVEAFSYGKLMDKFNNILLTL